MCVCELARLYFPKSCSHASQENVNAPHVEVVLKKTKQKNNQCDAPKFYTDSLSPAPLFFCTFPASLWWNWLISYCTGCAALASYSMIPAFGYILKFLHFVFQRILVLTNKCVNCIMTLCFWSHLRIRVSQFCAGYTISENYTQQRCNDESEMTAAPFRVHRGAGSTQVRSVTSYRK